MTVSDPSLSNLERDAIGMLLAGDDPRLGQLRRQLDVCWVRSREMTGVGFWTYLALPPTIEGVGSQLRARLRERLLQCIRTRRWPFRFRPNECCPLGWLIRF